MPLSIPTFAFDWMKTLFQANYGTVNISRRLASALLIFFAVGVLQYVFDHFLFNCPAKRHRAYAVICFFIPPILLFMVGWLSNLDLQNAIRGVFYNTCREVDPCDPQPMVHWRNVCKVILTSHVVALLAPFAWFVTALLRGQIAECMWYGPVNATMHAQVMQDQDYIYSQFSGFLTLVVGVMAGLIGLTIKLCCSKRAPGKAISKLDRIDNYITYEAEAAQQRFDELMRETALANGRRKVEMLLAARKPNLDSLSGIERDMKEMSYGHFNDVERSLEEMYPRIRNEFNGICVSYVKAVWEENDSDFINGLQKSHGSSVHKDEGEKPTNELELKDTSRGERMNLLKDASQASYA